MNIDFHDVTILLSRVRIVRAITPFFILQIVSSLMILIFFFWYDINSNTKLYICENQKHFAWFVLLFGNWL